MFQGRVLLALCTAICVALQGCATPPPAPPPDPSYLRDDLFGLTREPVRVDDLFALSPAMRHYLKFDMARELRNGGPVRGLVNALYHNDKLKLSYDSSMTRNAAEAFEARKGNCLSLVIMTAAFAKEMGLDVVYETVAVDETWSRSDDLLFSNIHVNVTLGTRVVNSNLQYDAYRQVTVDFLPEQDLVGQSTETIPENTVVAMFMNNRAAETLAEGRFDEAYAWARAAVMQAPGFSVPFNTLGVVYLRHGDLQTAERVFRRLLAENPRDKKALSNLVVVLDKQGRSAEAVELREHLARLEPYPPYHFFWLGAEAMKRGDYVAARSLFRKEVARADYCSEFHFWLGLADLHLGDVDGARREIAIALENSTNVGEHDLYAGKLERLRAHSGH